MAFQVGSEVSYHELAQTVGNIDTATVERYLDLLEKVFVIFKLLAFSRNLRNEIKKEKKAKFSTSFLQAYPQHQTQLISKANFESFLGV